MILDKESKDFFTKNPVVTGLARPLVGAAEETLQAGKDLIRELWKLGVAYYERKQAQENGGALPFTEGNNARSLNGHPTYNQIPASTIQAYEIRESGVKRLPCKPCNYSGLAGASAGNHRDYIRGRAAPRESLSRREKVILGSLITLMILCVILAFL